MSDKTGVVDTNEDAFIAARGMAIKLLEVAGTRAIPGTDNRCQELLTVNLPVFQFATPVEYVKLFEIRATPLAGDLLAAAWLALFHSGHLTSVMKIIKPVATPLVTYWSGSPYWLGPPGTTGGRTVQYSFVPRFKGTAPHTGPKRNSERLLSLNEWIYISGCVYIFGACLCAGQAEMRYCR
jgi:hypothetical protein